MRAERQSLGSFLVAGAMLVCLPLVAIQGPAHTTPMDLVNVLFVAVYTAVLLACRERIELPLVAPVWLIFLGGCTGCFAAENLPRALLTMTEDLYLFVWFVTLVNFVSRRCRIDHVALLFVAVACAVAVLTFADAHWGVAGGRFAGDKRATGTFENPNMFGDYLVTAFFVTWATGAVSRLVYLALIPLLIGIYVTHSNGALVSLIGGCCAVVAAYRWFWQPRCLGAMLVLGAIVLGVVGVWHDDIQEAMLQRMSGSRTEVGGAAMKGASERLPIWKSAFNDVIQTPTGVGPGNFNDWSDLSGDYHAAHSEYVGMLAERGFIGFAGWLGVLGGLFFMIDRLRRAAERGWEPLGVPALYGLLGAIAAHALVIELSHFRHTWMVFALLAGASAQAATVLRAAPVADPGGRPRRPGAQSLPRAA